MWTLDGATKSAHELLFALRWASWDSNGGEPPTFFILDQLQILGASLHLGGWALAHWKFTSSVVWDHNPSKYDFWCKNHMGSYMDIVDKCWPRLWEILSSLILWGGPNKNRRAHENWKLTSDHLLFGRPCGSTLQVCYLISSGVVFKIFVSVRFLCSR